VIDVLKVPLEENLEIIQDSVSFLKKKAKRLFTMQSISSTDTNIIRSMR